MSDLIPPKDPADCLVCQRCGELTFRHLFLSGEGLAFLAQLGGFTLVYDEDRTPTLADCPSCRNPRRRKEDDGILRFVQCTACGRVFVPVEIAVEGDVHQPSIEFSQREDYEECPACGGPIAPYGARR